jgi:hypothetical protein
MSVTRKTKSTYDANRDFLRITGVGGFRLAPLTRAELRALGMDDVKDETPVPRADLVRRVKRESGARAGDKRDIRCTDASQKGGGK